MPLERYSVFKGRKIWFFKCSYDARFMLKVTYPLFATLTLSTTFGSVRQITIF